MLRLDGAGAHETLRISQAKSKEQAASHRDAAGKADEIAAKSKAAATENVEPIINGVKVGSNLGPWVVVRDEGS
jgi:hypothetical protein